MYMWRSMFKTDQYRKGDKGFTLIEMIVVLAIFSLLTTLILTNHARFGGAILLENLAYDIGLTVRKAQVYGIAVRSFGGADFDVGYGIHFKSATPTAYILFGDATEDGLYEADQSELVELNTMKGGFHIVDICATPSGLPETCGRETLDILFRRPEPDAFISANGVSGIANPGALHQQGRVILGSPRGDQISVIVEATGQIAIQ